MFNIYKIASNIILIKQCTAEAVCNKWLDTIHVLCTFTLNSYIYKLLLCANSLEYCSTVYSDFDFDLENYNVLHNLII